MNLNEVLNIRVRNNPDSLLDLLIRSALLSIVVVVLLSVFGFYHTFSGFVIKAAENSSIQLCQMLVEQHKKLMFTESSDNNSLLTIPKNVLPHFDSSLRQSLAPFGVVMVKVFDSEGRIVYSTDSSLTGGYEKGNRQLQSGLAGNRTARLEGRDKACNLSGETMHNVDLVDTYVPVMGGSNRVLGCFEICMDVTSSRDRVRQAVILSTFLLSMLMFSVFGFSYLLIRGGIAQLKESQARLEQLALTDQLTGIANRSHLIKRGEEEFERVQRSTGIYIKTIGCIMVDLDFMKRINENRGEQAGDQVLKEVADRLRKNIRPYDILGRYGGEEFVIMLPDTSFKQSLLVAERIRSKIRSEPFVIEGEPLSLTVSLGATASGQADRSLSDIIKRSDEAMQKAKADGRDRVSWVYHPFDTEIHS